MNSNFYNSSTSFLSSISKWRIFPTLFLLISFMILMSIDAEGQNCDNVTDAGSIGYAQSVCEGEAPALIESVELPSGGSGQLEYVWLKSYDGGNTDVSISNTNAPTYQPGTITQDTWYRRCSRRAGCYSYDGESNWIKISIASGNLTDGGVIGIDQTICSGDDVTINNITLPSGGGCNSIEYLWLTNTSGPSTGGATGYPSSSSSYTFNNLTETTWVRRCSRREGYSSWNYGESNWVKITVDDVVSLTVCNNGTCPVDLYHWVSTGDEYETQLSAGECYTVNDYVGEMYRVVHGAWGNLEYDEHTTIDGCGSQTWNVQPTYCIPPCNGANCQHECKLNDHGQADYSSETRLLWLEFASLGNEIREYSVVNNNSKIVEYTDGTALITGVAEQIDDPSYKWEYHVKLINKRNWAEWSALGRSYKPGVPGSDNTTWSYYEVDATDSYFTGLGSHAGEMMNISHNPSNYDFGFQIGYGANDKNSNYGLSGWYKFDGAYTGHGDFNGNLDDCSSSTPFQGDWAFGCGDGKRVDIYGKGIKNSVPAILDIPSASNVYQVVAEIVYKGSNPGETIELEDDNGTIYTAYREVPTGGSSNVWVYRALMQPTSTVIYNNTTNQNYLQSLMAYTFRMNVQGAQQKGTFTHVSGYNDIQTVTFDIPTDAVNRDITLAVPISELTPDGRYLLLRASAGGVSNQHIIYGPNSDLGNCCLDIVYVTLSNVPGYATELTLEIDTRNNQNGQNVNGQSYVMAGAVTVDVECVCEDYAELTPPADVTIECTDSTDPTETNYPTLCNQDITDAIYTDSETGGCPNTITRTWTYTRTSELIINRTVSNTFSSCGSGTEYSFWYNTTYGTGDNDYRYFTLQNATFKEFTDGTAHLVGQLVNQGDANLRFSLDVTFSGRTMTTPMGSPKDAGCFSLDDSDYYYYLQTQGTLTGQGDFAGALVNISRNGPAMQLGTGANVQENLFGASGWLIPEVVSQPSGYTLPSCPQGCADFNFRLSGSAGDIN
ncbi:MAG TPA: hypothetical protein ENK52_06475, partial [Saprospiraceae bacterium]|nr:hypothetical protein [Saprospiraceae bacterium]